jgi:hypothetical protein
MRDSVQPPCLLRLMPAPRQQQLSLLIHEGAKRQAAGKPLPAGRKPRRHRRLAAGQHHTHPLVELGHEHLAQPRVHQVEHLEVIERQHHQRLHRGQPRDDTTDLTLATSLRCRQRLQYTCSVGSIEPQSRRIVFAPAVRISSRNIVVRADLPIPASPWM